MKCSLITICVRTVAINEDDRHNRAAFEELELEDPKTRIVYVSPECILQNDELTVLYRKASTIGLRLA